MNARSDTPIGREEELRVISELLLAAQTGRGRLVVISGEAGMGKSRLARFALDQGRSLGFQAALASATSVASPGEDPAFQSVIPWLSQLGLSTPSREESAWAFMQALLARLALRAAERPIVWLVEDLQRADAASLDLLQFLAHPLEALPVLLVATIRTNDPQEATGPYVSRRASLERLGSWLRLGPLSPDAALTIATRKLRRPLTFEEKERVRRNGSGNPFFIEQTAWQIENHSQAPSSAIKELVTARVAALPARCASLLETASVLGPEFQVATLAELTRALPATTIDILDAAQKADLVREIEPGRFCFSHALYGETLLASQPSARRRELHEHAALAYRKAGPSLRIRLEGARHLLRAALLGANGIDLEAVRETVRELDRAECADQAHALNLLIWSAQKLGSLPPPTVEDLLDLARIARRAGAYEDARRACLSAAEAALADLDPYPLCKVALALGAETTAAHIDPELVHTLRRALDRTGERLPVVTLRLQARLAAALQPAPDPQVPCDMARSALALAHAVDDEEALSDILYFCGAALTDFAPAEELAQIAERLLTLCSQRGDHVRALRACSRLALARLAAGDFEGVDATLETSAYHAETCPPSQRWRHLLLASMRAFAHGAIRESERLTVEAERLADLTDEPALLISVLAHRAHHQATLGAVEHLDATLEAVRASVQRLGVNRWVANAVNAVLLSRVRERERCARELHAIPDGALRTLMLSFVCLAEACAYAGTDTQVRIAEAALADHSSSHVTSGHVPLTYEGPSDRLRSLVAARLFDFDTALRHMANARMQCEKAALVTWKARVSVEHATLLLQAGRTQQATTTIQEAVALCRELGCAQLSEHLPTLEPQAILLRPPTGHASLLREGELWVLSYADRTVRLAHSRGVEILARLIARPHEEIHVLTLSSDEERQLVDSDAGQVLDARALREYRTRLSRLTAHMAKEAQGATRRSMAAEVEWLRREIARADGKGAAPRRAGSLAERARVNVQRRLKDTLERIDQLDPALAQLLRSALRTGTYCTFRP